MQQQIKTLALDAIHDKLFPGVVVGVLIDNQTSIYSYGGLTYDSDAIKTTPDTVYDLASITKLVPTASLILNLIDKGSLSLDSKVIDFVPEIKARYREEITIRHLLTYTV